MATKDVIKNIILEQGIDTSTDEFLSIKPKLLQNCTLTQKHTPKKRNGFSLHKTVSGTPISQIAGEDGDLVIETSLGIESRAYSPTSPIYVNPLLSKTKNTTGRCGFYHQMENCLVEVRPYERLYSDFIKITSKNGTIYSQVLNNRSQALKVGSAIVLCNFSGFSVIQDSLTPAMSTYAITGFPVAAIAPSFFCHYSGSGDFFFHVARVDVYKYQISKLKLDGTTVTTVLYDATAGSPIGEGNCVCIKQHSNGSIYVFFQKNTVANNHVIKCAIFTSSLVFSSEVSGTYESSILNTEIILTNIDAIETSDAKFALFISGNISMTFPSGPTTSQYAGNNFFNGTMTSAGVFAFGSRVKDMTIYSQAFLQGGNAMIYLSRVVNEATGFINISFNLSATGFYFASLSNGALYLSPICLMSNAANSLAADLAGGCSLLPTVSSTKFQIQPVIPDFENAVNVVYATQDNLGGVFLNAIVMAVDFIGLKRSAPFIFNGERIFCGSYPRVLSADQYLIPYNFGYFPVISSPEEVAAGSLAAGSYKIVARYKTITNNKYDYSPFSSPITFTVGASKKIRFYFEDIPAYLGLGNVDIFITEANGNDYFSCAFTQVGNIIEVTLVGNIAAPFTQNSLEQGMPSAMSSMTIYKNRIFGVSLEEDNTALYSMLLDAGNINGLPKFINGALYVKIEDSFADNTGLLRCVSTIDDKLILTKDTGIFYLYGDGPDNNGEGEFISPQLVSSEVGCDNPRSMVISNSGLMFQSQKGIFLLSRSLQTQYIGQEVQAYNQEFISGALVFDTKNLIMFTTQNSDALIYDSMTEQWSIFKNYSANCLCTFKGKISHTKTSKKVYVESTGFSDDGSFIPIRVTLNWIKTDVASIQDFQRIKRIIILGVYKSKHILKVQLSYNYEKFIWDSFTYDPADGGTYNTTVKPDLEDYYTGKFSGVYQFRLSPTKQKCESIKIDIFDEQNGSIVGESLELSTISMIIGKKKGHYKVPSAKRL